MKAYHPSGEKMKEDTRIALLEQSIGHINETMLRMEKRFDRSDQKLGDLEKKLETKIHRIEDKINSVDEKIGNHFKWIMGTVVLSILVPIGLKIFHFIN
jgi:hypothetical protein